MCCEGKSCMDLLTPGRGEGVHALLSRLLGRCTCEGARVHELYTVEGARSAPEQLIA